jgi:hypothetical protein
MKFPFGFRHVWWVSKHVFNHAPAKDKLSSDDGRGFTGRPGTSFDALLSAKCHPQ